MTTPNVLATRYARLMDCPSERWLGSRDWLTTAECHELDRLGHELRRRQWLAGRWLAKQLIQRATGSARLADLQILARDLRGLGVRPQISQCGRKLPWSVSISHSERGVLVAVAPGAGSAVGVDLVELASGSAMAGSAGFRRLWFTAEEQRWLSGDLPRRSATLWALKEAVYKACNTGEPWSPRQIEIVPLQSDRFQCWYRGLLLDRISLSVRDLDGHIAAVAHTPNVPALLPPPRQILRRRDLQPFEFSRDPRFDRQLASSFRKSS